MSSAVQPQLCVYSVPMVRMLTALAVVLVWLARWDGLVEAAKPPARVALPADTQWLKGQRIVRIAQGAN